MKCINKIYFPLLGQKRSSLRRWSEKKEDHDEENEGINKK
jgi:hypothetical protein